MATIRRNPMSVDTTSLSEQYMNFLEYKGLNTNKNYVSIDQETFTEANNVYVNQENQLSTRPPEKIFVMTKGWKAIKVWKINDKTFYHLQYTGNTDTTKGITQNAYYLACPASWNSSGFQLYEVSSTIYLCWLNFAYCLFESDQITAIVYSENKINFYTNDDAVYFPVTEFHVGTEIYTIDSPDSSNKYTIQNYNVLTDGYIERYVFDPTIGDTPTPNLIGKTVTVILNNTTYTITWKKYNEKVLYEQIGKAIVSKSGLVDGVQQNIRFQVANAATGLVYVITVEIPDQTNKSGADLSTNYISTDGNVWYDFSIPAYTITKNDTTKLYEFTPLQYPVLSSQGGYVYYLSYVSKLGADDAEFAQIVIHRKQVNSTTISAFGDIDWTTFKTCDIGIGNSCVRVDSLSSATSISFYYYLPSYSKPLATYDTWSPWPPSAVGSADDYTVGYYLGFACKFDTYFKSTWARGNYYTGGITIISDSDTYTTKLVVETWDIDMSKYYYAGAHVTDMAYSNYNNKLSLIVLGQGGVLCLTRVGKRINYYYTGGTSVTVSETLDYSVQVTLLSNLAVIGRYTYQSIYFPVTTTSGTIYFQVTGFQLGANEIKVTSKNIVAFDQGYIYADNGVAKVDSEHPAWTRFTITKSVISDIKQVYDLSNYTDSIGSPDVTVRQTCPFTWATSTKSWTYISQTPTTGEDFKPVLSSTNTLYYDAIQLYDGQYTVQLLQYGRPLYIDSNDVAVWCDRDTGNIYSNQYTETISVDNLVKGSIDYIMPEHSVDFITTCLSQGNIFYQSSKTLIDTDITKGKNLFYIPKNIKNDNIFTDKITALVNFSQTTLGIFLETTAYQLTYDSSNDVYYLSKTKLALGNRDGSDMLLSYDGNNIYITTLKGLSTLNYQDFVQSTEQIYTYLTEAVMDLYQVYAKYPIKLCQYKDWLFLYRTNSAEVFVYDLRSSSWWKWTLPQYPKQLVYINDSKFTDDLVLVDEDGGMHTFKFDEVSVYDNELTPFNWSFTTQKMHFGAPNNYKHIRSVSIVTEQSGKPLRFKLKFTNYRNLNNLSDSDTVEYDIDQLTTMIKRVNFIKTNAFQLQVSNDKTDKYPQAFVTPNIAIKYRITERLR